MIPDSGVSIVDEVPIGRSEQSGSQAIAPSKEDQERIAAARLLVENSHLNGNQAALEVLRAMQSPSVVTTETPSIAMEFDQLLNRLDLGNLRTSLMDLDVFLETQLKAGKIEQTESVSYYQKIGQHCLNILLPQLRDTSVSLATILPSIQIYQRYSQFDQQWINKEVENAVKIRIDQLYTSQTNTDIIRLRAIDILDQAVSARLMTPERAEAIRFGLKG